MNSSRPRRSLPLLALGSLLLLHAFVTGCAREEGNVPDLNSPEVVGAAAPAPTASGIAIAKAGVNPPSGATFTCWIKGSGFRSGDKVLVNGKTEIATTFGDPGLVTFAGGVELLQGRTSISLVVYRPGTELRSNSFDAAIRFGAPEA